MSNFSTATTTPRPAADGPPPPSPAGPGSRRGLLRSRRLTELITFVAFMVILAVLALWLGGAFLNVSGRVLDVHTQATVLLMSLGVATALVANQFDLSVGGMATLSAYLTLGLMVNQDLPAGVAIAAAVGSGVLVGLGNALLVARWGINAFLATLGMQGVLIGLARVYSKGSTLAPSTPAEDAAVPGWFSGPGSFGTFPARPPEPVMWALALIVLALVVVAGVRALRAGDRFGGLSRLLIVGALVVTAPVVLLPVLEQISWMVLFLLIVATVLWILLDRTVLGRNLYAVGGNPTAAALAGVNVKRTTTVAFIASSVCASLAGVVLVANQGAVQPDIGNQFLLAAFAGAFLSTVLLSAGRFHVWGTLLGSAFVLWVGQGLVIGDLPFTVKELVNGLILIGAVGVSRLVRANRD